MSFSRKKKKNPCENSFSVSYIRLITEKMCSWYGPNCYWDRYIFSIYNQKLWPCKIQIYFVKYYWPVYMQHSHFRIVFSLLISVMAPAWQLGMSVRKRLAGRSNILEPFTSFIHTYKFSFMDMHEDFSHPLNSISDPCVLLTKIV